MLQTLESFLTPCAKYKSVHDTASYMTAEFDIEDVLPFLKENRDNNSIYLFPVLKGKSATNMCGGTVL